MNRQEVQSSNLKSIGYSPLRKKLEVEFKSGDVYRYKAVPKTTYNTLMNSTSKGKYLNTHIKYQYPYRKFIDKDGSRVDGEWKAMQRKTASEIIYEMIK